MGVKRETIKHWLRKIKAFDAESLAEEMSAAAVQVLNDRLRKLDAEDLAMHLKDAAEYGQPSDVEESDRQAFKKLAEMMEDTYHDGLQDELLTQLSEDGDLEAMCEAFRSFVAWAERNGIILEPVECEPLDGCLVDLPLHVLQEA